MIRCRFVTAVGVLLYTLAVGAVWPAQPAPNVLSPQEISAGWILLFDGETTFGWKVVGGQPWMVSGGELCAPKGAPSTFATTTEFAGLLMKAEVKLERGAKAWIQLRRSPTGRSYEVFLADSISAQRAWGRWTPIQIRGQDRRLEITIGRRTSRPTAEVPSRGAIALRSDGKADVRFRSIKLQPLGLESIFNGKDLTGWTVLPRGRSVYSVTPEGWLNVKNGSGDIQTTRTWADFVLQLDIFSNGDHLNSGIFFRAEPGRFWSGYESQIRNEWEGNDRTKPVDFGTGGIYNQQPARKVVSSDREWFTKTIVAHGPHIAVWVNGYQVSDWTDTRPASDNARTGYRAKAGAISIQGHDPTTDLSFRNIRIAELPPPAS
ncbi:MAG: 3-keto-disaccharide hydrolase [Armatimonadota bacterium]